MTGASSPQAGIFVLVGSAILAITSPAAAASGEDHGIQGWTIAAQLCSRCHVIGKEPQQGEHVGPDFRTIAAMPSTTGVALNVFLQSHHQWMPSVQLDRDELDAVIDYVLSLKTAEPARP